MSFGISSSDLTLEIDAWMLVYILLNQNQGEQKNKLASAVTVILHESL